MAYKFPWTNYHELNLDWILDTVKKLFAQTEQNNAIVEQYDGRLTEVELTADNAQTAAEQAQSNSATALDLAQNAAQTATQAQQAAATAQQAAGQAQTAAGQALEAAATAQQTATQAQQTAQNFDGRIRQAEDNAASALQAAQAFDEQVQGAITAANNANEAATAALTSATETARELAAQRDTLEGIVSDGVDSLQEAAQDATTEIETVGQSVLNSIPADYTALSELVDKKADVIYNTASGDIASFNDGADDMKIKGLIVNVEPSQAGSGDPSPTNIRPISGWTGAEIELKGKNLLPKGNDKTANGITFIVQDNGEVVVTGTATALTFWGVQFTIPAGTYVLNGCPSGGGGSSYSVDVRDNVSGSGISGIRADVGNGSTFTLTEELTAYVNIRIASGYAAPSGGLKISPMIRIASESDVTFEPYTVSQISVTFPSEAGTVYGGTLDVISGKLIVDKVKITIDGDTVRFNGKIGADNVAVPAVQLNLVGLPASVSYNNQIASNYLKKWTTAIAAEPNTFNASGNLVSAHINNIVGFGTGMTYTTLAELLAAANSYVSANNLEIVYLLANPVEYQLTPQEVKTLYQYNNIWSDVGSVNVEYPADTKTYIDNKFAELQALILEH